MDRGCPICRRRTIADAPLEVRIAPLEVRIAHLAVHAVHLSHRCVRRGRRRWSALAPGATRLSPATTLSARGDHRAAPARELDEHAEEASVPADERIGLLWGAWFFVPYIAWDNPSFANEVAATVKTHAGPEGVTDARLAEWAEKFASAKAGKAKAGKAKAGKAKAAKVKAAAKPRSAGKAGQS